ncbi:hypothetical protein FHR75_002236 [Kineococcus radiotolerans]|uniref:Uncharacterized protein n=1 Tax=Kineococcus radiotolerans TaxID=131568 RepID=A0A7W4TM46_KINRA|nr:hypothetical protein [Kineococcus radiotolerans]MBB2901448.1 hypothetical protein [Kineococcus radiotolerans]
MALIVSFAVILLVAALVGRVCSRARPGERRAGGGSSWPGVLGGEFGRTVHLPDTGHHHAGWGHSPDGGWGGDSGGSGGGDSGGGGGGS